MQVAAFAVSTGYRVAFVPPSSTPGTKTPDLRIASGETVLSAECKRKDAYDITAVEEAAWPSLESRIAKLLDELNADYEVIVVALGTFEDGDDAEILNGIRAAITGGFEGGPLTRRGASHTLYLRKLALPPPSSRGGLEATPGKARRGVRYADVYRGQDGLFYVRSNRGVWLYSVDSHKLASIVRSFNTARSQLPANEPGVIYIDLDVSAVEDKDMRFYLESAASALRHLFSPSANTRVAAVVVTASVDLAPPAWQRDMAFTITRNPFHPLAASIRLPPEPALTNP